VLRLSATTSQLVAIELAAAKRFCQRSRQPVCEAEISRYRVCSRRGGLDAVYRVRLVGRFGAA
jgi:hypothetical protein